MTGVWRLGVECEACWPATNASTAEVDDLAAIGIGILAVAM